MQVQGESLAEGIHHVRQVRNRAGEVDLHRGGVHAEKGFLLHPLGSAGAAAAAGVVYREHYQRETVVVGIDERRGHGRGRGAAACHHDDWSPGGLYPAQSKEGGRAVIGHAPAVNDRAVGQRAVERGIQFTGAAYPFGYAGHGCAGNEREHGVQLVGGENFRGEGRCVPPCAGVRCR